MAFRDFKSNGWQWQRSHVRMPDHANRLWLAMALAYGWMLSLGTYVYQTEAVQKEVTRGRWLRESVSVAEEETLPQETLPQETPEGSSPQGKLLVAPSAEAHVRPRKRHIRRQSVFRLGLRFFKRWVDLGRPLFYDLWLMLDFPIPAKTVV